MPASIERASCDSKTSTSQFNDATNPVVVSAGKRHRAKAILFSSKGTFSGRNDRTRVCLNRPQLLPPFLTTTTTTSYDNAAKPMYPTL